MPSYLTLGGDLVIIPTGAGTGDMSASTYDPTSVSGDAFNTINHSDTLATITGNTVLVSKTKYYNNSGSNLVHTLPSATAGKWVFVFKAGAGNIRINRAGTDTIVDGSSTYIENTTAEDAGTAFLLLYCQTNGLWSIHDIMKTWAYA